MTEKQIATILDTIQRQQHLIRSLEKKLVDQEQIIQRHENNLRALDTWVDYISGHINVDMEDYKTLESFGWRYRTN